MSDVLSPALPLFVVRYHFCHPCCRFLAPVVASVVRVVAFFIPLSLLSPVLSFFGARCRLSVSGELPREHSSSSVTCPSPAVNGRRWQDCGGGQVAWGDLYALYVGQTLGWIVRANGRSRCLALRPAAVSGETMRGEGRWLAVSVRATVGRAALPLLVVAQALKILISEQGDPLARQRNLEFIDL